MIPYEYHKYVALGSCLLSGISASVFFLNFLGAYTFYVSIGILTIGAIASVIPVEKKKPVFLKLGGLEWTQEEFNHSFFLSGAVGSGKTNCIRNILRDLFERVPNWGGVWVDAKGDSHQTLIDAAEKAGRRNDVIMLEVAYQGMRVYPIQRMNLLLAGGLDDGVIAQIVGEISNRPESKSKESGFFFDQTVQQVREGMKFLAYLDRPVTMHELRTLLCNQDAMDMTLKSLGGHWEKLEEGPNARKRWVPDENPWFHYWVGSYLNQPPNQFGGVSSSINNALSPFLTDEVREVFSSDMPDTVDFSDIENGKIICVVAPSSDPRAKQYLTQYFKALFFFLVTRRYDLRKFKTNPENQLVLFADEYQYAAAVTDVQHVDKIRDAKAALIASSQDAGSLIPVVGEAVAKTILGNIRNKVTFSAVNPESAKYSASLFGEKTVWKTSYSYSGGKTTRSRSQQDEFILKPNHFMRMKNHYCAILHTNKKIRKRVKLPQI